MSYKALYRIYRPQDFNEVAGQKHITTTLKNALTNDKVAHAYLFSGPRGTGKTSIAKIFAKAVNCVNAPIDNPCNECENCKGITSGVISDIIEIDAASNNGVDEIREIRDKVKYLPGYVKYKVYIIDEVHMLSTGAFNALLKTLEEPPAHVIFILCTTEPQKIPLTIHSRCQRFDFKSITTKDIIGKLEEIIQIENIVIDIDAIHQIAVFAEGGLRDAISLLDQVRAYSPERITEDDVNQISGAVSISMQIELANALIEGNSTKAIELLNSLITEGKEVRKIAFNLIEFFRDVLMSKNLRELDPNNLLYKNERFIEISKKITNRKTFYVLDILNKVFNEIKWSNNPKIYLELAFIKVTDDEIGGEAKLVSVIDNLEKRIVELENREPEIIRSFIEPKHTDVHKTDKLVSDEIDDSDILEDIEVEDPLFNNEENFEGKTVVEEVDEPVTNEMEEIEKILCDDLNQTYSIEFVETVLNNGNRDDKNTLLNSWERLRRSSNTEEEKHFAQILEAGKIAASSINKIIITFPSASICNKLMAPNNTEIVKKVLKNNYNREIDFIALPENIFEDIAKEFTSLWRQGKRQIKLSKIECEGLKNVSQEVKETEEDTQPKIVKDALDLFGDIVKIKE
ncbi:MAG: DNA polymerase III subunit gamma/tau [Tenericutes bacterium]|nr:DNA polymerase III subunit gamma/tau [Mycoplasmatota bacterium]